MNAAEMAAELIATRKSAGLTQAELARRMGTTQSAIARAETNWEKLPTLEFLERFARAIGQPMTITVGLDRATSPAQARRRALSNLAGYEFNPWERPQSEVEANALVREGLTPEQFESKKASRRRRKRT